MRYVTIIYTRYSGSGQPEYVITPDELRTIRQKKLYPFFDKGGGGDNVGDYQKVGKTKLCLDVTSTFIPFGEILETLG